ncbi:MAG: hypothetical protein ACJ784_09310 [Myxococcales bacterium]
MRALPLAMATLLATPALSAPLEFELGGGLGRVFGESYPWAPVVSARVGSTSPGFRPGVRIFAAIGPAGGPAAALPGASGKAGYQAAALLLDLRYSGSHAYASAGVGVGKVFSLQQSLSFEQFPLTGSPNIAAQAALGIRTAAHPRVGLEAGVTYFSGIKREGQAGQGPGPEDDIKKAAVHFLFTLAFSG